MRHHWNIYGGEAYIFHCFLRKIGVHGARLKCIWQKFLFGDLFQKGHFWANDDQNTYTARAMRATTPDFLYKVDMLAPVREKILCSLAARTKIRLILLLVISKVHPKLPIAISRRGVRAKPEHESYSGILFFLWA